mmetsp:Transcript_14928/g.32028  ORF Transcript_14928/g.32028 Transcript_14928/m.32028 type:complete len:91 (+) Transcript_14928:275-547(+)
MRPQRTTDGVCASLTTPINAEELSLGAAVCLLMKTVNRLRLMTTMTPTKRATRSGFMLLFSAEISAAPPAALVQLTALLVLDTICLKFLS